MERREHDRLARPGRRRSDRRPPVADNRRVLLVGQDEGWRLLTAYLFEEVGYVAYTAADQLQAVALTTRILPDVVVVQTGTVDTLELLARTSEGSSTSDIPVVVLMSSLQSTEAQRAREAGGVTLLAPAEGDVLVGEVDTLIASAARARRALRRRLLAIQELARHFTPDAEGQARLRHLIDRLQVAILAVDEQGHCLAASQGATRLTGYSRSQLLTTSVFQAGFAGGHVSDERWREFLVTRHDAWTTTITNRAGENVAVHAATVEIMPGFHVAAFAPA